MKSKFKWNIFYFIIIIFIIFLSSCNKQDSYNSLERDFFSKRTDFFLNDDYSNKELSCYQYDDYYFFHYSYVTNSTKEDFERISIWKFSKNLNGYDMYKEIAHIYLKPYNLSNKYNDEYVLYLNAIKNEAIKLYSEAEIKDIENKLKDSSLIHTS